MPIALTKLFNIRVLFASWVAVQWNKGIKWRNVQYTSAPTSFQGSCLPVLTKYFAGEYSTVGTYYTRIIWINVHAQNDCNILLAIEGYFLLWKIFFKKSQEYSVCWNYTTLLQKITFSEFFPEEDLLTGSSWKHSFLLMSIHKQIK